MGFCHKAVVFVKVKLEFSVGSLCTLFFHYVFASLGFDFVNQCSLPLARLFGIAWFITFNVGV